MASSSSSSSSSDAKRKFDASPASESRPAKSRAKGRCIVFAFTVETREGVDPLTLICVERDEDWFPASFDYIWDHCIGKDAAVIERGITWKSKIMWRHMIRLISKEDGDAGAHSARDVPMSDRKVYLSMPNEEEAESYAEENYDCSLWLIDITGLEECIGQIWSAQTLAVRVNYE